jgi:hypothetical protein
VIEANLEISMSGLVFLLDVVVFVALIYWTSRNGERPEGEGEGLFGVKTVTAKDDMRRSGPRWRQAITIVGHRSQARPSSDRPGPHWRVSPHRKPQPPRRR